ncbi:hypothetical protein [Fusobacterium polymorphum]|uniref:hypothetical protein n=1 Tax=Fusobacterium nucleatum subsp. polymorphum TaxID=76857 RepID=UPI0030CBF2D1
MHEHTFYKISDSLDINILKDSNELNKIKNVYTLEDKKVKKPILKEKEYQNIIYMLATTSDKKINYRKYDDEAVIEMSDNGSYMTPYNKPVLKNHNDWSGEPLGRALDSFAIDHKTLSYKSPYNSELSEEVIEYFKENNCFKDGKTSIILKCFVDNNTMEKIKDGYYLTVSQGITCSDMICNICGESFFKCSHYAGSTYKVNDIETECMPKAIGPFIAEEISIVNIPANDTSIIYVPEKKEEPNSVSASDNKNIQNQAQIDNQENQCKDSKNNNNIKDNKGGSTMLKDLLRKSLLKDIKNVWTLKDEMSEKIETFFNSLEEEKIEDFISIINILQDSTNEKIKVIEDSVTELKPYSATGTLGQTEEQDKQVEDEKKQTQEQKSENNNKQQNQQEQTVNDNKNPDENKLQDNSVITNTENVENEIKDYKDKLKDSNSQNSKENDEVMAMLLNN